MALHMTRHFIIYNLNLTGVMIKSRNIRKDNIVSYSEGHGSGYLSEDQLLRLATFSEAVAGKCWHGTLPHASKILPSSKIVIHTLNEGRRYQTGKAEVSVTSLELH